MSLGICNDMSSSMIVYVITQGSWGFRLKHLSFLFGDDIQNSLS